MVAGLNTNRSDTLGQHATQTPHAPSQPIVIPVRQAKPVSDSVLSNVPAH
jgi:hypothetical protein